MEKPEKGKTMQMLRGRETTIVRRREKGFTLIELMVALLILGVLMVSVYRIFSSQEHLFRVQEQAAEMQENLRATTEFMNQEMSWVGYRVSGGLSVAYASSTELIYLANLPNTGATIQYVRYKFDPANALIQRAVADTIGGVMTSGNMKVLASDVSSLDFTYYNVDGATIGITDSTPATSSLMNPPGVNDPILRTIQRIRSTIVVMSSRPDWSYTHPTAGDHYRRRAGIIDVKARNLEDITLAGAGVGTGECSSLTMNVTVPGGQYSACPDKTQEINMGIPDLTDNPQITVNITSPSGSTDTVNDATVSADNSYIIYDASATQDNLIKTGETLYLSAGDLAVSDEGTVVTITTGFRNTSEIGCLQVSQTETVMISSGIASHFDTTAPYDVNPITAEYVDLGTGNALSPQPGDLAACPSESNEGLKLTVRLADDCGNGIEGQTVNFSAVAGSFQTGTLDNGDGTYEVIYVPPDTITVGVPLDTDTVTADWVEGSQSQSTTVSLKSAAPDHIVINDITGPVSYGFLKTGTDSFEIWRLQNQTVTTNLSVLDQCGNRVYGEEFDTTMTPTNGTTTPDPNPTAETDGTYTFYWTSEDSCGDAVTGQGIQIDNTHTPSKTVTFDLLTTPPSVFNLALNLNLGASDPDLDAGGNAPLCSDHVDITASIVENIAGVCGNLTDPFVVDFSVAGQTAGLGNGSFTAVAGDTTLSADSDAGGVAHATLYPGDARYDQKLDVNAVAKIGGAPTDAATIQVNMKATPVQDILSGIYDSSGYSNERNLIYPDRSFNPGDVFFPRVVDCDENERITLRDPSGYPPVQAIFQSLLTGDTVTVDLTEDTSNSADFRLPAGVSTQLNAVANTGDTVLQVGYGDQITMYYADKDDNPPPPNLTFAWHSDVYISGPRWMKLYQVDPANNETLITGPAYELWDGDRYRAKVYIPEFDGDSGPSAVGTMTDTAAANAQYGGETDNFTLREAANTGIFITDGATYGGVDYNTVSKSPNPPAPNDQVWLNIPYTPDRVTVYYPDTASPIFTGSFLIHDSDLPDVSITPPTANSGTIPIEVGADDTGNYIDPGIDAIQLYIDGVDVQDWISPAAIPVTFDWVTESAGKVFWLNGQHTVYARAQDKAGNWEKTPDLTVTVSNPGATAINFTQPAPNSVLSQSMIVAFQAPDVDNYSIYTCSISGMSSAPADVPMAVGNTCTFTWDLSSITDGAYSLTGTITDNQLNSEITATPLVVIVDRTAPTVDLGTPSAWVGDQFPVTVDVDVTDANGVDNTSVNGDLNGACTNLSGEPFSAVSGTTYRYIWSGNCPGVDGSQTLTVRGSDLAVPPNEGSSTVTVSVDTIHPVLAPINASPIAGTYLSTGSFVNGVVTITSSVMDNHAASAFVSFALLPGSPVVYPRPLDNPSTGAFHYTWDTSGKTQGLYEVTVSGKDMAANANTNTEVAYLYVDRTAPGLTGPVVNPSDPGYAVSVVPVDTSVNDPFGFVNRFGVFVYDAPSASSPIESDIGTTYPPIAAVSSTSVTFTMDTRLRTANGTYYIQSYAEDHAGNANSTVRVPFEVCNRVAQITSHSFTPSGVNYSLTVLGSVVQLKPTGPAPVDLEPLDLLVQPASAASFHVAGSTTAGAFSITTPPSDKLILGDKIDVQLTDTGSGCDAAFTIDKPSYSYTVQ